MSNSNDNKPVTLNNWNFTGLSEGRIQGENEMSLYKMVGVDIHSRAGLLKSNKMLTKISGATVDGFVKKQVPCSDGYVYMLSSTSGKIWQYKTSDGSFTLVYTANSPVGDDNIIGACEYNNYLYFATQNYLYRIQLDKTTETWSSYVEEVGHLNLDYVVGDAGFLGGNDASALLYTALIEDSTVTFTAATNKVNLTGHGFVNTDKVVFESTGTLPAILTAGTAYYVVNKGADDFEVSLTSDGAALDIADTGTGVHTVLGNGSTAFTPQGKTMTGVAINLSVKPTTSLVLTLHSDTHASLATKTVANANLAVGINEIYWDTAVTNINDEAVHLHVYQVGTSGAVLTAVADEFAETYLEIFKSSNAIYHPMTVLNDILYIGDGSSIHQVENYLVLNALDIPSQFTVSALGSIGIVLLVGTTVTSLIHSAKIYQWNTWSESWSVEDEIPEVGINAFLPVDNFIYVIAGKITNVYYYNGEHLQLYRRIGGEFSGTNSAKVYPDAVASLNGIPLIGVSNVSGNAIEQGVYSFGTANPRLFPRVFCLDMVSSQGTTGLEIGSVCVHGDNIFVAWKKTVGETITYGIDGLSSTDLYSGAYIQTRVLYKNRNVRTVYRGVRINYMEIQDNTPLTVTFNGTTNKVALTAHGFQDGEAIVFSGGTPPTEIVLGTTYYVVSKTANDFQIATTATGSAIDFTGNGTGTTKVAQVYLARLYYRKDYATAWTELTLIHDTDKKQFKTDTFGDFAFCIEFKLELRARGATCPVIDELTFYDQDYAI